MYFPCYLNGNSMLVQFLLILVEPRPCTSKFRVYLAI